MGLLDDLRKQADSLKSEEQKERERQQRLTDFYQAEINPKLLKTYRYLHELSQYLNTIQPDVAVSYDFPVAGRVNGFKQDDYQINADSDREMKEIRFVFMCRRKQDFDVHADNRGDVEKLEDFLAKHTLAHRCKKEKDSAFNVTGGYFTIGSTIPVAIHFSANIEKSAIDVHLVNFEEIGGRTAQIKPDQITDDLLDELGKYILRQENRFLKLELSEEERMRIRAQVEAAQQQMDKAVSIADATLRAEALERKDGGLLKFFRSR